MEPKELEKVEDKEVVRKSNGGAAAGFDDVDVNADIKMPRLLILQGLSELVSQGKGMVGQIANSVTEEIYGDHIDIIPLFMFKTRARFEVGRGLVMMSRDNKFVTMAKDEFADYEGRPVQEAPGYAWDGSEPPSFGEIFNYPVLLADSPNAFPLSLTFMRSAIKVAKELNSKAFFTGEDFFSRVYRLSSRQENGKKGAFSMPVIEIVGRASDEQYEAGKQSYQTFHKQKEDIAVDLEAE